MGGAVTSLDRNSPTVRLSPTPLCLPHTTHPSTVGDGASNPGQGSTTSETAPWDPTRTAERRCRSRSICTCKGGSEDGELGITFHRRRRRRRRRQPHSRLLLPKTSYTSAPDGWIAVQQRCGDLKEPQKVGRKLHVVLQTGKREKRRGGGRIDKHQCQWCD